MTIAKARPRRRRHHTVRGLGLVLSILPYQGRGQHRHRGGGNITVAKLIARLGSVT